MLFQTFVSTVMCVAQKPVIIYNMQTRPLLIQETLPGIINKVDVELFMTQRQFLDKEN